MKALSQALAVMLLTGYLTGVVGASGNAAADTRQPAIRSSLAQATARTQVSPAFSCRTPANEQMAATCAALERQMLDATVYLRLTLDCPASGEVFHLSSRATVMDERTVLTHDHFKDVDEPGCVIIWETRIQWVRPLYTEAQAQAFGLVLDQAVYHGASGGGVFRYAAGQIVHIGNVWGTWEEDDRSLVALNRAEALR